MAELTGLASPVNRAALRLRLEVAAIVLVVLLALGAGLQHLVRPDGYVVDGVIFVGVALLALGRIISRRRRYFGAAARWDELRAGVEAAVRAARGRTGGEPTASLTSNAAVEQHGARVGAGRMEQGGAIEIEAVYRGGLIIPRTALEIDDGTPLRVSIMAERGAQILHAAPVSASASALGLLARLPRTVAAYYWAAAAVVVVIALAFRLYALDAIPGEFYGDIAIIYEYVDSIVRGQFPFYFALSTGPLYGYVITPLVLVLGQQGYMTYKLASVLVSLAGVCFTFLLARQLSSTPIAILSALVLGASSWYVIFSRLGNAQILIPVVVAASYYLLASGVRAASTRRVQAGLGVASLGLYLMPQTFVLPLAYLVSAAFFLPWRRVVLLAAAAAALALPLGLLVWSQPDVFLSSYGYIGGKAPFHPDPLGKVAENIWASLLMFHIRGDATFRSNPPGQPQLDPLSGVLLIVGILYWLKRPRSVWLPMLLVPLVILQVPVNLVLSETRPTPSASRAIGILPFVAFAVASGLWLACRPLKDGLVRWTVIFGMVGLILGTNWIRYFDDYAEGLPDRNTPFGKIIAETLDGLPPGTSAIVYSCCWGEWGQPEPKGIQYSLEQPRAVQFTPSGSFSCDLLKEAGRPAYVVWDPTETDAEVTPATCDPRATVEVRKSADGATIFIGYAIPSEP